MREVAGGDAVDFTSERITPVKPGLHAQIQRVATGGPPQQPRRAERLAHARAGARAYFSKLHRKLAQIFSTFFGFWPDSSPEGGNKSRLQAGRDRVLAPESIAFPVFALI